MSGVTLSGELEALHRETRLATQQLADLTRAGIRASFMPPETRDSALAEVERAWATAR
jgi:hypothetical protein